MDNSVIANQIDLMAKLMELHGENSFKVKNYAFAVTMIKKLNEPLTSPEAVQNSGLGAAVQAKIIELIQHGRIEVLEKLLEVTPSGILDMLKIKGLGPKKIAVLWQSYGIDSLESLESACLENRLMTIKGFGLKTQAKIYEQIEFLKDNQGYVLWKQADDWKRELELLILSRLEGDYSFLGAYSLQHPVLNELECWTTIDIAALEEVILDVDHFEIIQNDNFCIQFIGSNGLLTTFYCTDKQTYVQKCFEASCSIDFYNAFIKQYPLPTVFENEHALFEQLNLPFIPLYLRDNVDVIEHVHEIDFNAIILDGQLKGGIHNHSVWSDGINTIEEMALECIALGWEYLVISDHSQSAGYANGLSPERILQQHKEIDLLNQKLAPFKIFKSIESDILGDGSLDYEPAILDLFDLVIASVHSNLNMTEEVAMARLTKAMLNPYTSILGHPTGRLLLARKGYDLDYDALIAAAKANQVVIEINANPRRLDLDIKYIKKAVDAGLLLSINPDAHSTSQLSLTTYGIRAAQKGMLPRVMNLSSYSLAEMEDFVAQQKLKRSK